MTVFAGHLTRATRKRLLVYRSGLLDGARLGWAAAQAGRSWEETERLAAESLHDVMRQEGVVTELGPLEQAAP